MRTCLSANSVQWSPMRCSSEMISQTRGQWSPRCLVSQYNSLHYPVRQSMFRHWSTFLHTTIVDKQLVWTSKLSSSAYITLQGTNGTQKVIARSDPEEVWKRPVQCTDLWTEGGGHSEEKMDWVIGPPRVIWPQPTQITDTQQIKSPRFTRSNSQQKAVFPFDGISLQGFQAGLDGVHPSESCRQIVRSNRDLSTGTWLLLKIAAHTLSTWKLLCPLPINVEKSQDTLNVTMLRD